MKRARITIAENGPYLVEWREGEALPNEEKFAAGLEPRWEDRSGRSTETGHAGGRRLPWYRALRHQPRGAGHLVSTRHSTPQFPLHPYSLTYNPRTPP